MKLRNVIAIAASLNMGLAVSADIGGYESYKLQKGDWISKIMADRGFDAQNDEIMATVLNKNNLTRQAARDLKVGTTVWIPTKEEKVETVAAPLPSLDEEIDPDWSENELDQINEVQSAVLQEDIDSFQGAATQANQHSLEVGAFHQKVKTAVETNDIQINTRAAYHYKRTSSNLDSAFKDFGVRVFGNFYNDTNTQFSQNLQLDPGYGIQSYLTIALGNAFDIRPTATIEETSNLTANSIELGERRDRIGKLGLALNKDVVWGEKNISWTAGANRIVANSNVDNPFNQANLMGTDYFAQGTFFFSDDVYTTAFTTVEEFDESSLENNYKTGLDIGLIF